MFDVNIKIAKTKQNSWNFLNCQKVVSTEMKKWQTSKIIQEISNSNLETGRYGPKSGLARLSRRVDSTALVWDHMIGT